MNFFYTFFLRLIMRFLILFTLLLAPLTFAQTDSPRQTMQTYLKAMVEVKNQQGNLRENYEKAISTFDLSNISTEVRYEIGKRYAEQLIHTFDKIKKVDYEIIPENLTATKWTFDSRLFNNRSLEISMINLDGKWLFSQATLKNLKDYDEALILKKSVEGVVELQTLGDKFRSQFPPSFAKRSFLIYNWQWVGLLFIIFIAWVLEKIFDFLAHIILNKNFSFLREHSTDKLQKAINPLGKILFLSIFLFGFPILEFEAKTLSIGKRLLYIIMSVVCIWFAHKLIDLISFYAKANAQKTETKFDDIIIPLLTKTAYVLAYIFGFVLIANSLTINVTGIVAGLGIGGLAFAFAAKDALANFFGSIMLVLDRPFDIGDVITADGITGVVDEVGFRSTRIRTFNDSLITISNGALMNMTIDNQGKRRYRRLNTTLGLEYDTPPQKIEAFCEGIRQLILNHSWTRKDNFHVYFTNFGASSLDITLVVYWKTSDYSRELAEKHRLMVDVLRLADEIGVSFAFPTQTVHLFNQQDQEKKNLDEKYLDAGIDRAKKVLQKPFSLKNPRSNSEDEEQFGKNDIGL